MKINYNGKKFKPLSNSENGEVSEDMIFTYHQNGNILESSYSGGEIVKGHLIGIVSENGEIDMRYHQINKSGNIMTGTCQSKPEIMENGKIKLYETWQWTSGDQSHGSSVLMEEE